MPKSGRPASTAARTRGSATASRLRSKGACPSVSSWPYSSGWTFGRAPVSTIPSRISIRCPMSCTSGIEGMISGTAPGHAGHGQWIALGRALRGDARRVHLMRSDDADGASPHRAYSGSCGALGASEPTPSERRSDSSKISAAGPGRNRREPQPRVLPGFLHQRLIRFGTVATAGRALTISIGGINQNAHNPQELFVLNRSFFVRFSFQLRFRFGTYPQACIAVVCVG